jgi:hemerythrin-like domain-containing protein
MPPVSLTEALTREHREIDEGIEQFLRALDRGTFEADHLLGSIEALRRHIDLEETFLFPRLRQAGLMMPVMVMLREHGELWSHMETVVRLLSGATDRSDSAEIRTECHELLARLDQHNTKEEPIIYPRADADLPIDTTAELRSFLETGTAPAGWVCEAAR